MPFFAYFGQNMWFERLWTHSKVIYLGYKSFDILNAGLHGISELWFDWEVKILANLCSNLTSMIIKKRYFLDILVLKRLSFKYLYKSSLCLSKKADFDVVLIVKRDIRCNKTPNFQNFERFQIIHFCPKEFFSRLINFRNRFFGTNPISYIVRVDVIDQEYMYFSHVQMSSF